MKTTLIAQCRQRSIANTITDKSVVNVQYFLTVSGLRGAGAVPEHVLREAAWPDLPTYLLGRLSDTHVGCRVVNSYDLAADNESAPRSACDSRDRPPAEHGRRAGSMLLIRRLTLGAWPGRA